MVKNKNNESLKCFLEFVLANLRNDYWTILINDRDYIITSDRYYYQLKISPTTKGYFLDISFLKNDFVFSYQYHREKNIITTNNVYDGDFELMSDLCSQIVDMIVKKLSQTANNIVDLHKKKGD